MIDEDATRVRFGYTSDTLSKESHKIVVCLCDNCGKERDSEYKQYRNLCISCSLLGRKYSDKTIIKMSKSRKEYFNKNPNMRKEVSDKSIKQFSDPEHRKLHSNIMKKLRYDHPEKWNDAIKNMVDDDIVKHHYVYDESDLSKYTIEMTRSQHAYLHWNLRKSNIEIPHINIKDVV